MMSIATILRPLKRSTAQTPFSILHILCLIISAISCVSAYELEVSPDEQNSILFRRLAEAGEIHVDQRALPSLRDAALVRRDVIASESGMVTATMSPIRSVSSPASSPTVTTINGASSRSGNSTASVASRTSSASTSTETVPTTLPSPFDTSLGINFTAQSCPIFFNKFLNNATFNGCLPVSLLLQNSMGFFRAFKSATYLDKILDNSCKAPLAVCSPLMSSLADQLVDDSNCGADYNKQNALVMQAYAGLLAYEPIYNATCIQNPTSGNYCFVDAIVNATNAADMYPYYLALGMPLPDNARLTCNTCLKQTMQVFAGYATIKGQPVSNTYLSGAGQINGACGSSFADTNVKVGASSSKKNAATRSQYSLLAIGASTIVFSCLMVV